MGGLGGGGGGGEEFVWCELREQVACSVCLCLYVCERGCGVGGLEGGGGGVRVL